MSHRDPRLKLVLVDDHELARTALVRRLREHAQILVAGVASDPLEARDVVVAQQPHVALVDTIREDGQGPAIVSLLARLPAATRPVVVVHLSYYQPEQWDLARSAGADDLILKQISIEVLAARLLQAAQRVLPSGRWPDILHA